MSTPDSPDVFRSPNARGAGVRRLNRIPLIAVFALFVIVMGVVTYTVLDRSNDANMQGKRAAKNADPASSDGIFDGAPTAGLIAAAEPAEIPSKPRELRRSSIPHDGASTSQPGDSDAYAHEWQQYRQQQSQVRQAKMQSEMAALTAAPSITDFSSSSDLKGASSSAPSQPSMFADGKSDLAAQAEALAASGQNGAAVDENNAAGKKAWLDGKTSSADYLPGTRTAPVSPFEVKTGTVIPGIMIGGINSDLPGQIIAQVRENVYDTATGQHLLIPQGARLVGTYDNQVTRGQSRVLVAWNRIIYPDSSSIDLGMMPGSDQAGYSGFSDKVNNHYVRVFGDAMLLSLFSAGIQLSQPQSNSASQSTYDSQQIVAASLGQQLGQSGMQLIQKNLNIQPTLEIRPGYRFNVMVTKDMILPPWVQS
jgi:type IV secretion system protein TrbI